MSSLAAGPCRPRFRLRPLVAACLFGASLGAHAATHTVHDAAGLAAAIVAVNASSGANFIEFAADISLSSALPPITGTVTIKGNNFILDGGGNQLLVLGADSGRRILVQVTELTLTGAQLQGSTGSDGAGGGAGAGAAVQVHSRADVVLNDVIITANAALGGDGAALVTAASGNNGGYGEGGDAGGLGGVGGGNGGLAGGGGGGALGGGIYVAEGGGLTVSGATTLAANTVTAGLGANDGSAGAQAGSGMFLQGSGNLVLRVSGTETMTLADDISDAAGSGLAGASPDDKWNLFITGGGGIPVDAGDPGKGSNYAAVELAGDNRFGGDFYVSGADLHVSLNSNLGSAGSMLALDDGGIYLAPGMTLDHDVVINSGGGRFGIESGEAILTNDISGAGVLTKVGSGALVLAGTTSANGNWRVNGGVLVLDQDSRLGSAGLVLNGGGILYSAAFDDLRALNVTENGGGLHNNGQDIHITNTISGDGALRFDGTGHFHVDQQMTNTGGTFVDGGTVSGRIGHGNLTVDTDAVYQLTADQQVTKLLGGGAVVLGSHDLTSRFFGTSDDEVSAAFDGVISGDGQLVMRGNEYATLILSGINTYTGGTRVEGGVVSISDDANVGSGDVTLAAGTLLLGQNSSQLHVVVEGSGTLETGTDVVFSGEISDNGSAIALYKTGTGTLTLDHANSYSGTTTVSGDGSLIALLNEQGLGNSELVLMNNGGLKLLTDADSLREVRLAQGNGVIDTNGFDATVTQSMSGGGSLVKNGLGDLVLTANSSYAGNTTVSAGVLQVGTGGATGTLGNGNTLIAANATLLINRAGTISIGGDMTGEGDLVKTGSGLLALRTSTDLFNGTVSVLGGMVGFYDDGQLGRQPVLLDNRGGLELMQGLNPDFSFTPTGIMETDITVGAGGGTLASSGINSWTLEGDTAGSGTLYKTGTGEIIVTGVLGQTGGTDVERGTLQIGSGLTGTLTGDVIVRQDGTLVFGREDLTLYSGVIDGDGTVIKRGAGELVLTGEQLFDGVFQVEAGNLRIGLGGTAGSLSGDVDLAADTKLIFDRSDDAVFDGGTSGAGLVQKSGPGELIVTDALMHTGGTLLNSGILTIGNGGTSGDIAGNVTTVVGTQLAFNRSDDIDVDANVSGAGRIVQRGSGVLTLTGTNTQSDGVLIENGTVAVDSDARLGGGDLVMDGGMLRYDMAFDDLRNIILRDGGGGLDTNGFDVRHGGLITGDGPFIKDGDGKLVFTGSLAATLLDIQRGEFQLGDLSAFGSLSGNVSVASGATFSLSITGDIVFNGSLTGAGTFRQLHGGELRMQGDYSAFTGLTVVERGSLRLNGVLGGGLDLFDSTALRGNATIAGNVNAANGALLAPGNSIGTINIGGNLALNAGSILEIELDAAGASDRINVSGNALLAGTLQLLPLPGDYTAPGCCTYTILTAATVTGTFSAVNNDLVFLDTTVNYLPGQVDVSFVRNNVGFNTISLTQNQQQVSAALDAMEAADPSSPLPLLLAPLTADQARTAFDDLSGDSLLGTVNTSARVARRFSHLLSSHSSRLGLASRGGSTEPMENSLAAVRAGNMPAAPAAFSQASAIDPRHYDGPTSKVEGVWVEANVFKLTESADDTVGSAASTFDGQLLALGVDGYWSNNLILGFAAGYLQGDMAFDNRRAEGSSTGEFVGSYGRWETNSGWHYKAALTLGQQNTDQTRSGSIGGTAMKAASSVEVMSATAEFEAGIALHLGNYGLRPYALLDVQYLERDDIRESGAAEANLHVDAATDMLGEFGVGAEISRPWLTDGARWAQIVGGLALMQPFGDTQREQTVRFNGSSNSFTIKATPDDSAALQLTLGGEWYLSKSVALWGGYEGRISSSTQEHNGVLSVQYRW